MPSFPTFPSHRPQHPFPVFPSPSPTSLVALPALPTAVSAHPALLQPSTASPHQSSLHIPHPNFPPSPPDQLPSCLLFRQQHFCASSLLTETPSHLYLAKAGAVIMGTTQLHRRSPGRGTVLGLCTHALLEELLEAWAPSLRGAWSRVGCSAPEPEGCWWMGAKNLQKIERLETETTLERMHADVSEPCHHKSCSRIWWHRQSQSNSWRISFLSPF